MEHGKKWTWELGCRCDECRREKNFLTREWLHQHYYELKTLHNTKAHAAGETCRWCR